MSLPILLDVLRHPFEAITISHLADNTAHENLEWTDIGVNKIHLPLASSEIVEPKMIAKFIFRSCIGNVNLVA
ncbi:hypothetical protein OIU84_021114 [Salix udensis]|uniref:Uncharacterized protein n=1 Tax=Salix udensis TaxID=889485 RepID=A0AAD6KUC2_9ROSI|nr:hypothetical protein OIU84_021114 [Salix udensis]